MVETLDIDMCLTHEFLDASDACATGLFFGYFKTFKIVAFPSPQKTNMIFQHRIYGVLN